MSGLFFVIWCLEFIFCVPSATSDAEGKPKFQTNEINQVGVWDLDIVIYLLFGIWCLGFFKYIYLR